MEASPSPGPTLCSWSSERDLAGEREKPRQCHWLTWQRYFWHTEEVMSSGRQCLVFELKLYGRDHFYHRLFIQKAEHCQDVVAWWRSCLWAVEVTSSHHLGLPVSPGESTPSSTSCHEGLAFLEAQGLLLSIYRVKRNRFRLNCS